ncbi:MAG: UDP-glucose/GDP-mannose dehydrogenase family protein [Hyphomicrobiales bacterium]|nr:UDP-glucose/GDP-mannose dehydrogenase family protein [Hyphomicrobiales bacterium]MDE2114805.1 UDP-glucose/GDP-mannose dehydrogenase family protein [Hyphomicrobiales bacterium]
MRLAVIGAGYVGLVSSACFASLGHEVILVETDPDRFADLKSRRLHLYEPNLEELVALQTTSGMLRFSNCLDQAVQGVDAVFLAVGTPSHWGDGHVDTDALVQAVERLALCLRHSIVLVTKSTVPVGTSRKISQQMRKLRPDLAIEVAANPEFLRNGRAINDFMRPDRIVLGCEGPRAHAFMQAVYQPLESHCANIIYTELETAEMIKYAANSFLGMKIAFINEMSDICESLGADIEAVGDALGLDRRIGSAYLNPGPGFGGASLPGDLQALATSAKHAGVPSRLIEATISANQSRQNTLASRVSAACGGSLRGKKIAVLGLTYKPDTDDISNSPALPLLEGLVDLGAQVHAYDPMGMDNAYAQFHGSVKFCASLQCAVQQADAVITVTDWSEFRRLNPRKLLEAMRGNVFVDLRNIFDPCTMRMAGFNYHSLGRSQAEQAPFIMASAYHFDKRIVLC